MNIIYVLIPLSVLLMILASGAFFWAVRNDQFDDLDTPALDILDEDDRPGARSPRRDGDAAEQAEGPDTAGGQAAQRED